MEEYNPKRFLEIIAPLKAEGKSWEKIVDHLTSVMKPPKSKPWEARSATALLSKLTKKFASDSSIEPSVSKKDDKTEDLLVSKQSLVSSDKSISVDDLSNSKTEKEEDPYPSGDDIDLSLKRETKDLIVPTGNELISPDNPLVPPTLLFEEQITVQEYREAMRWVIRLWKSGKFESITHESLPDNKSTLMPQIPSDSHNPSSVSVNHLLKKLALEKAKTDPKYPSGVKLGLSGLIAWKLWEYLGCPGEWPPEKD